MAIQTMQNQITDHPSKKFKIIHGDPNRFYCSFIGGAMDGIPLSDRIAIEGHDYERLEIRKHPEKEAWDPDTKQFKTVNIHYEVYTKVQARSSWGDFYFYAWDEIPAEEVNNIVIPIVNEYMEKYFPLGEAKYKSNNPFMNTDELEKIFDEMGKQMLKILGSDFNKAGAAAFKAGEAFKKLPSPKAGWGKDYNPLKYKWDEDQEEDFAVFEIPEDRIPEFEISFKRLSEEIKEKFISKEKIIVDDLFHKYLMNCSVEQNLGLFSTVDGAPTFADFLIKTKKDLSINYYFMEI